MSVMRAEIGNGRLGTSEALQFRYGCVVWPPEICENSEAGRELWKSIEGLNKDEIDKWRANTEYVPIHYIVLLPPEDGVVPQPLTEIEVEELADEMALRLGAIVRRLVIEKNQ